MYFLMMFNKAEKPPILPQNAGKMCLHERDSFPELDSKFLQARMASPRDPLLRKRIWPIQYTWLPSINYQP